MFALADRLVLCFRVLEGLVFMVFWLFLWFVVLGCFGLELVVYGFLYFREFPGFSDFLYF